jgi:hypothetical protein
MEIKYEPQNDSVVVNIVSSDGRCQHRSTHREYDEGEPEEYTIVVCNHCSAYRRIMSSEWLGIQVMPVGARLL